MLWLVLRHGLPNGRRPCYGSSFGTPIRPCYGRVSKTQEFALYACLMPLKLLPVQLFAYGGVKLPGDDRRRLIQHPVPPVDCIV